MVDWSLTSFLSTLFVQAVICFVWGTAGFLLGARYGWTSRGKREFPFVWKCLQHPCDFEVKSNDIETLTAEADRHERFDHGDWGPG